MTLMERLRIKTAFRSGDVDVFVAESVEMYLRASTNRRHVLATLAPEAILIRTADGILALDVHGESVDPERYARLISGTCD